MASPVRQSEISPRAHLDQPGGGALELTRLKTFVRAIKRAGFSFRRSNELHRVVVERVDQDDETLGLVAPVVIHDRDTIENNRMILTRDLEIVGGGEWLLTQIRKREARHSHARARHADSVPLHHQVLRFSRVPRGQTPPRLVEGGLRRAIGRNVPNRHASKLFQPEIGTRIERSDFQMLFDELDERQEKRTVEAVLVELARRYVRSCDHDHAEREQALEQSTENHRIGNIGDVELIEAKKPGLLRNGRSDEPDRILPADFTELGLLPQRVDALMNLAHEFVEMDATLAHHSRCCEEHVHQHGLAATNIAEDVKALDRLSLARSKQPAQRGRLAREPPLGKRVFELREAINNRPLGIRAFDLSSGYLRRILRRDGSGHEVNERSVEGLRRIASLQHQPQAASRGRIIARWWLREAPSTRASASKLLQKMAREPRGVCADRGERQSR